MPTWKEQQDAIDALRLQREKQSDELYKAQIQFNATTALLSRVKRNETSLPPDQQQIEALRVQIEQLKTELRKISLEFNEIELFFAQLKQNEQFIIFLQKKIEVVTALLNETKQKLREEEDKQTPDEKIIADLKKEIDQFEKLLDELNRSLEKAKSDEQKLKDQQQAAIAKQRELDVKRNDLQNQINSLEADLAGLLQQGSDEDPKEIQKTLDLQKTNYELAKSKNHAAGISVTNAIEQLYHDPHPRTGLTQLTDNIPFLLMPVRIETRFMTGEKQPELWLRIYPDDIAIHTHEKLLTAKELAEGITYWKRLFDAEKNGGEAKEDMKKAAWNKLVENFRPQRSGWIAIQTRPTNWSDDLREFGDVSELIFPQPEHTKPDTWSRAPRVNVLPDRFVITLYENDVVTKEVVGNIIPDELFVGPDPMEPADSFLTKDNKLVFGESYDWMSDFEKAIKNGMGFKIPLTASQATNGFSRILAFGVNLSASSTTAKKLVEDLIDNHHYSPNGFSLVPQGSATNNTEDHGSGYTKNDSLDTSYVSEAGKPLFSETDKCDGKNLADALGIDYAPLQNILHSDGKDLEEAIAMNTALYPSTLGYYFDTMLKPVLNESNQESLRDFFVDNVTGRGPLPAIRVGDQPYGILLTSNFEKWKWDTNGIALRRTILNKRFLDNLYNILKHFHEIWKKLLSELNYVGKLKVLPPEILSSIIGMQPNSASIFQRIGYTTDHLATLDEFQYGGKYFDNYYFNALNNITLTVDFLKRFGYTADNKDVEQVLQLLHLVYQKEPTKLDASNIVDNVPLSEIDRITYYDAAAKKNYLHWLSEIEKIGILEKQNFGPGITVPSALMYMQLRRSLTLQLHKASTLRLKKDDLNVDFTIGSKNFYNIRPGGDISKWEVMRAKVSHAAPNHPQEVMMVSEFLLGMGKNEEEAAFLTAMKKSLALLANLPTARLERIFIEHLDACNYRLDSWQTGIFNLRLSQQRKLQSQTREKGIYLGSYGWVEHVKPSGKHKLVSDEVPEKLKPKNNKPLFEYADNGGFVHAPSLNHASAAAVLRSGYMSHATALEPGIMAVNLSSERVRRALFILDGMRNGQTLEALLGYQFERGLHDRGSADDNLKKLNLYIYNFRDAYPLLNHHILQQGTNTAVESIPANNVVNGVTLAESKTSFPFGASLSASVPEREAIILEKDKLSDTLDAVKDLLTAESVYQLVQGNFERCGALINAVKDANIPAELDVIDTPRGSHFSFTNRVVINFGQVDPLNMANKPWPSNFTHRARMEAGINKWLGKVIGAPENIVYRVSHPDAMGQPQDEEVWTLEQLSIQPIDIIYIIGSILNTDEEDKTSLSELESRIAYHYKEKHGLEDTTTIKIEFKLPSGVAGKQTFAEILPLLRMLRLMITDARYLDAEDFEPHSKKSLADKNNPKALDAAELLSRIQQIQILFTSNINKITGLQILATIPDPDAGNLLTDYNNLKDAFDALDKAKLSFEDIDFNFENDDVVKLQNILIDVSNFGIADSFPKYSSVFTNKTKALLLEQAKGITRRMMATDKSVTTILTASIPLTEVQKKISEYLRAGKLMLQESFNILPLFSFNNESDIQLSQSSSVQLLEFARDVLKMKYPVEEWIQNASHVRPRLSRWDQIRTLYELNNTEELNVQALQVPYRINDNWLAVQYQDPEIDPLTKKPVESFKPFNIMHDTLSIVTHGENFIPGTKQSGLLIDDWTEMMPTNEETTGITFNYNQPNAMPPQALLLTVTPEVKGHWTWDDLIGILNDTLNRAKLRAVEPDLLDGQLKPKNNVLLPAEIYVLRPAIIADFTQYDLNISLDYKMNLEMLAHKLPIISLA